MKRVERKYDSSSSLEAEEEAWTEVEEDATDSGYSTGSLSPSPPPPPPKKRPKRPKQKQPQKRPKTEVGVVTPPPPPPPVVSPPAPPPVIPQKYPPRSAAGAAPPRPRRKSPTSQGETSIPHRGGSSKKKKQQQQRSRASLLETLCQAYAAYASERHRQRKATGWRSVVRQAYEKVKKNARGRENEETEKPAAAQEAIE